MLRCFHILLLFAVFGHISAATALIKAVDGDSLTDGETRIRLDGIDAPEIFQTCRNNKGEEYACGQEAYLYLQRLTADHDVHCSCLPQKDKYNRDLCECFVGDLSLNQKMVEAGWALPYRTEKYAAQQNSATVQKRGLWQGKFMRPALFRALERLLQKEYKH